MTNGMAVQVETPEIKALNVADQVPQEIRERADEWLAAYAHSMTQYVETAAQKAALAKPEAGSTTTSGYKYLDVVLVGPQQFSGSAPWKPSKIIAAGEWARFLAIVFVNPADAPGGSISGRVALGARDYSVKLETINLSTVTDGPDAVKNDTFPNVPKIFTYWEYWFMPIDPGPNPHLFEVHCTADVTVGAQPFAAFSTWHYDPDTDPTFLIPRPIEPFGPIGGSFPTIPAGWRYESPARYLVYRK
jgi:hypothetical protein